MQAPSIPDNPARQPQSQGYLLWGGLALLLHLLLLWFAGPKPSLPPPVQAPKAVKATLLRFQEQPKAYSSQVGQGGELPTQGEREVVAPQPQGSPGHQGQAQPGRQQQVDDQGVLPADPFARDTQAGGQQGSFGQQLEQSLQRLQQRQQDSWLQGQSPGGAKALPRPNARVRDEEIIELGENQRLYRGPNGECALLMDVEGLQGKETRWLSTSLCKEEGPDFREFIKKRQHRD
ncbi:hypothetical protein [Gallaecimonas xiamenensis]|uniref:Uncharacterized protein n=1 Tax=Gallaecimonas xiamenensis 3-C-1 TaxID=745411 RepID=K2K2I0_9GAMM|nr:hypothetical protein [Gallaecimonas xiamenensis]EKE71660.1 hypothetical protein B3C1_12014 [Gallaecimonas xiamenensis 3-C-1]